MPSIENRGQTDLDLDFQSPASYDHDHIHTKHLRSTISSLEWKQSVGQTDGHGRLQYILHILYIPSLLTRSLIAHISTVLGPNAKPKHTNCIWTVFDTYQLILVGSNSSERCLREDERFDVVWPSVFAELIIVNDRGLTAQLYQVNTRLILVHRVQYDLHMQTYKQIKQQ